MVIARFSEDESALYTVTCTVSEVQRLRVYCHCRACKGNGKQFNIRESCMAKEERCGYPSHSLEEAQRVCMFVQAGDDEICQFLKSELNKRAKQDRHQRSQSRFESISLGGTSLARRFEGRRDLRQQICDKIVGNSQGSYFLASLYLEDVASRTDVKQIEDVLLDLLKGLDWVYQAIMKGTEMQTEHVRKVGMTTLH